MAPQKKQTAILQSTDSSPTSSTSLPLEVSRTVPIPALPLPTKHHVLVRVLAVALNPTDHKMVRHFPKPGNMVGCDFCGVVIESQACDFPPGTRVCGGAFPYSLTADRGGDGGDGNGAFAEWIAADARLLLRLPDTIDDLHGAALGGVGWGTAGLAFFDPDALALTGRPSSPAGGTEPVLVYGGATASGTMACQLLKLCGYLPIAVTSVKSAPMAMEYGAVGAAPYTSAKCAETIKSLAGGKQIRHAMDCITTAESAAVCFAAMARTGGRYACLEGLPQGWRTRPSVRVKEVMGFEGLGSEVHLGDSCYSRAANQDLFEVTARWTAEMQKLVDAGKIKTHPIQEVPGQWDGILQGLALLERGEVRGQKLVVRISDR